MKKTKLSLFYSVVSLVLCASMLVGTTFAWFTDGVSTGRNTIAAGNLDVALDYLDAQGNWQSVDENTELFDDAALWEPGYTEVVYLRVRNQGSLALKYQLGVNILSETGSVNVNGDDFLLSDFILFDTIDDVETRFSDRDTARNEVTSPKLISEGHTKVGTMAKGDLPEYVALVVFMPGFVGNDANHMTGVAAPSIKLGIELIATQVENEADSFGADYDVAAGFPKMEGGSGTVSVPVENNIVTADTELVGKGFRVLIPAGTKMEEGATEATFTVKEKDATDSNVKIEENELLRPVEVHPTGVAKDNTMPITVFVEKAMMPGLNIGNYRVYHVENGVDIEMTAVAADELDAHNEFTYDPATGDTTLSMATFSEVALVAEEPKWEGNRDYSWYDANATEMKIANADQLAGFGAIVGGMDGKAADSFKGKTVKLIANINIGDLDSENDFMFYPIGYYNSTGSYTKVSGGSVSSGFNKFEGTFNGNGNTISNFYQNTWEAFGDYNDGYSGTPNHNRDGFGLFGKVYGGTVKNLTVENFSSDGEFATTGTIAAYADCGATFESIAIFDCNPRVYNIGNGGIVGCVGWYGLETAAEPVTFRNITVDNTNKISALWGSWDVACGGIVGQYYPTSGQSSANYPASKGLSLENCHVAAQIDVYNDVCANYQYYAYRYAGMLVGSVRENVEENGHLYPKMDGITASECTVHYGTWNVYYYCEFEANTMASYSEDYQFSRVPHSELNFTDSNGNGIIDTPVEQASVTGCKHNHTAQEDKQAVCLPFGQLVTGYGWGVTSKGLDDMSGVAILGRDEGSSYKKFEAKPGAKTKFKTGSEVKAGDLFRALELADGLKIYGDTVQLFVSPVGEDSTVSGTFTANASNWEEGALKLGGVGKAVVSITDYNYCLITTIEVEVRTYDYSISYINNGEVLATTGVIRNGQPFKLAEDPNAKAAETKAKQWAADQIGGTVQFGGWVNAGSSAVTEIAYDNDKDIELFPTFKKPYTARFVDLDGNVIAWCFFNGTEQNDLKKTEESARAIVAEVEGESQVGFDHWEVHVNGDEVKYEDATFAKYTTDVTIYPVYRYKGKLNLVPIDIDGDGQVNYYQVEAAAELDEETVIPGEVLGIPVKIVVKLYANSGNLDYSSGVKSVEIQEGVEELQHNSISYTKNLGYVKLPHSLKTIGKNAFSRNWGDDKKVLTIEYAGTMAEWESINKDGDWHNGLKEGSVVKCTDGEFVLDRGFLGIGYDWEKKPYN